MASHDQEHACTPLTRNCATIYATGDHAIVGLSPGNGYFTSRRIAGLARWGKLHFKSVHFVTLGEPFRWNLLAEGYSQEKAQISSARRERELLSRSVRALAAAGLEGPSSGVLNWSSLCAIPAYSESLAEVKETFRAGGDFADAIVGMTREYLLSKDLAGELTLDRRIQMATGYYLAELPLWLDAPRIFQQPSSSFCYQSASPFIEKLWTGGFSVSPSQNQGYLSVAENLSVVAPHSG